MQKQFGAVVVPIDYACQRCHVEETTETLQKSSVHCAGPAVATGPNGSTYSGSEASAASDSAATPCLCPRALLCPPGSIIHVRGLCSARLRQACGLQVTCARAWQLVFSTTVLTLVCTEKIALSKAQILTHRVLKYVNRCICSHGTSKVICLRANSTRRQQRSSALAGANDGSSPGWRHRERRRDALRLPPVSDQRKCSVEPGPAARLGYRECCRQLRPSQGASPHVLITGAGTQPGASEPDVTPQQTRPSPSGRRRLEFSPPPQRVRTSAASWNACFLPLSSSRRRRSTPSCGR